MNNDAEGVQMIDTGVDYWRFTYPEAADTFLTFKDVWERRITENLLADCEPVTFNNHGYRMRGAGGVALGMQERSWLFEASGPEADLLLRKTKGVIFDGKSTRLDTQCTLLYQEGGAPQPWEIGAAVRAREKAHVTKKRRSLGLIESADGCETVYVGSRTSASFLRYYTAGLVHSERYPRHAVRWEVQHQKRAAEWPARRMREAKDHTERAAGITIARVMMAGFSDEWHKSAIPLWPAPTFHKSSRDGTLKWYRSSVAASIKRARREGWLKEAIEALGLSDCCPGAIDVQSAILENGASLF